MHDLDVLHQPFNDFLNAIGGLKTQETIGICGAPGIGKSSVVRFLANILSQHHKVGYCSLGKTKEEIEFQLKIKRSELQPQSLFKTTIKESYNFFECIHDSFKYCKNQINERKLFESYCEFVENYYDLDDNSDDYTFRGFIEVIDIKHSKDMYEMVDQITLLLVENISFDVLIVDDLSLFKSKIFDIDSWDDKYILSELKKLALKHDFLLVLVSTISFHRTESDRITSGMFRYTDGGSAFIETCNKIYFVDRDAYYKTDELLIKKLEDNNYGKMQLTQVKNYFDFQIDTYIDINHSLDFGHLYLDSSVVTETIFESCLSEEIHISQNWFKGKVLFLISEFKLEEFDTNDSGYPSSKYVLYNTISDILESPDFAEFVKKYKTRNQKNLLEPNSSDLFSNDVAIWVLKDEKISSKFYIKSLLNNIFLLDFNVVVLLDKLCKDAMAHSFNEIKTLNDANDIVQVCNVTRLIKFIYKPELNYNL